MRCLVQQCINVAQDLFLHVLSSVLLLHTSPLPHLQRLNDRLQRIQVEIVKLEVCLPVVAGRAAEFKRVAACRSTTSVGIYGGRPSNRRTGPADDGGTLKHHTPCVPVGVGADDGVVECKSVFFASNAVGRTFKLASPLPNMSRQSKGSLQCIPRDGLAESDGTGCVAGKVICEDIQRIFTTDATGDN